MIDISKFSYDELLSLGLNIENRIKELEKSELKDSIISTVEALVAEGYGSEVAIETYCDECECLNTISWRLLLECLRQTHSYTD